MNKDDMLKLYRQKRDFRKTPEPLDDAVGKKVGVFVVQKHAASRLHYDFRLEVDGVLKSWAVPKGPSLDPAQRRLAVETEDHPLAYADFEGNIPVGEYGGGTVMVWDRGVYRNRKPEEGPLDQAWKQGRIEVELQGKKLRGAFALIRTGRDADRQWLLIKMKDEHTGREDILKTRPDSAKTGRSLEKIAAEESPEEGRQNA